MASKSILMDEILMCLAKNVGQLINDQLLFYYHQADNILTYQADNTHIYFRGISEIYHWGGEE